MTWDAIKTVLAVLDNIATIITAICAAGAFTVYVFRHREKRRRLERHLAKSRDGGNGNYLQRPVSYLVAEVGMTEIEIVDAAFRSRHIESRAGHQWMGTQSPQLLLRYTEKPTRRRGRRETK